jgi:hypothetical protein
MGYERLESPSQAMAQVVHTNHIHFRIKYSLAKREFDSGCQAEYQSEHIVGRGDIRGGRETIE